MYPLAWVEPVYIRCLNGNAAACTVNLAAWSKKLESYEGSPHKYREHLATFFHVVITEFVLPAISYSIVCFQNYAPSVSLQFKVLIDEAVEFDLEDFENQCIEDVIAIDGRSLETTLMK